MPSTALILSQVWDSPARPFSGMECFDEQRIPAPKAMMSYDNCLAVEAEANIGIAFLFSVSVLFLKMFLLDAAQSLDAHVHVLPYPDAMYLLGIFYGIYYAVNSFFMLCHAVEILNQTDLNSVESFDRMSLMLLHFRFGASCFLIYENVEAVIQVGRTWADWYTSWQPSLAMGAISWAVMAGYDFLRASLKLYQFYEATKEQEFKDATLEQKEKYEAFLEKLWDDFYYQGLRFVAFTLFALNPHLTLGYVVLLVVNALSITKCPKEYEREDDVPFLPLSRHMVGCVSAFFRGAQKPERAGGESAARLSPSA